MDRDEAEYLRKLREHVAETRWIFSNKMKQERERMVCRAFLRCLGIEFDDQEIMSADTEPIDVSFRAAKFQIRELIEQDRKRGDELKKFQQKVEDATSIEDLATPYSPPRPLSSQELLTELTKALSEKAAKYGTGCRDLDALVYVNLEGRHLDANSVLADVSKLRGQCWAQFQYFFRHIVWSFLQRAPLQRLSRWLLARLSRSVVIGILYSTKNRLLAANNWVETDADAAHPSR